jgi:hypothetical protein
VTPPFTPAVRYWKRTFILAKHTSASVLHAQGCRPPQMARMKLPSMRSIRLASANGVRRGAATPGASSWCNFAFPHETVDDLSLSVSQKRAILSEWASDVCSIKSFPTLRLLPGTNFPVTFSSIMDARSYLD